MSKSLGNTIAPQDVIKQSGADILRMWVASADYWDDQRIGPGNPQDHGRDLSQAAQHRPLDARQSRAFPRGRARQARRDAGARAADAAPAGRARRAGAQGLRRVRLQAHLRRALGFHDVGPVGLLFRHPQGRALLRSDLVDDAQGLPHRARPSVPLHGDLARADALLHRRGSLALALRRRRRARCIWKSSPRCRPPGATTALAEKWRKVRDRAPRRHRRAGDRARAKAHRLLARSASDRARFERGIVRGRRRHRSRRGLHHLGGDAGRRTRGRPTPSVCRMLPASRSCPISPRARKCARSWKILTTIGADPEYPDVSPRDAKALREWEAMRKAAE